jgi:hypothetical protein
VSDFEGIIKLFRNSDGSLLVSRDPYVRIIGSGEQDKHLI